MVIYFETVTSLFIVMCYIISLTFEVSQYSDLMLMYRQ